MVFKRHGFYRAFFIARTSLECKVRKKFSADVKKPNILLVRFGWLDSTDWIGQKAETGQQSRLSPDVESYKLIEIYKHT